jgi:hypothetical protein
LECTQIFHRSRHKVMDCLICQISKSNQSRIPSHEPYKLVTIHYYTINNLKLILSHMNHLKSKHHLSLHLFYWLSKEVGTKAAYTNTKDQHCKSMLYYPLEQNQNTCKGPLKRGTLYTVTNLSHVFTWWVWNAISVVTNKSPLDHSFIARKRHRIHNKHAHLPSFANQIL